MPNLLVNHPSSHRRRYKSCFIPCTIKFHPKYQHIGQNFAPILKNTHPNHINTITRFPNLTRYVNHMRQHPIPRILFALIVTTSSNINSCEHQLISISDPNSTSQLINKMTTLINALERHINTIHPLPQFLHVNQKIINSTNIIHKELYKFIQQNPNSLTIQTLTNKFPFFTNTLLAKSLKNHEPLP